MAKKKPAVRQLPKYLPKLFLFSSVVVLVIGVIVSHQQHTANVASIKHVVTTTAAPSTQKPSESSFDRYKVAADQPRYITIAKINVKAIVQALGVTSTNQIAAPSNVYDAGWYNQSRMPGQPGAMVIDGHVSSWTTHGIFYDLKTLKTGDAIQIEKGDGVKLNYVVVKTQTYDVYKVDMKSLLSPVDSMKPGLNLITCTGSVIKGTNQFDNRLIVFAKEV